MTGPEIVLDSHEAIGQRAADFCQRRHFGKWSGADQAELDAWLAESDAHRVAYLRVEWSAARVEQIAASRPFKPAQDEADDRPGMLRWWIGLPVLAAASIALFYVFGLPLASAWMTAPVRSFSTDVGGRTTLTFADQTQIELNTDTAVRFRITGEERTVWLDRGEAWFHVSHNAANPFTVIVGKHRIRDLGTEFDVRRGADGLDVTLVNGRATLSTEGAQTAMLTPGDEIVATPVAMSLTRKTQQELADELAWRRGVLVFRKTKLADAVREFNRYNQTKLVITDPVVAKMTLGGEFKADNLEHFLSLAQDVLKLRIEQQGNDILLSRETGEGKRAAH